MATIHFLNVKQGDCTWVKHNSSRITVIDVNNATEVIEKKAVLEQFAKVQGNFHQKDHPVNPIEYLKKYDISSVFRFILTHPDMDHMGGIKAFFNSFTVSNFWDTDNSKEMDSFEGSPYSEDDWLFYKDIRDGKNKAVSRHTFFAGDKNKYFNINEDGSSGADGLYILAPTKELVKEANESGEYNDCSYVILYRTGNGKKIIFSGDSEDKTWEYILNNYKSDVTDVDVLIAPHHGRDSGRNYDFLDVLNPKITYFGYAKSQHLAYDAWNNRNLDFITNNQANCIITDINDSTIKIYGTYETFAKKYNPDSYYESNFDAWHLLTL